MEVVVARAVAFEETKKNPSDGVPLHRGKRLDSTGAKADVGSTFHKVMSSPDINDQAISEKDSLVLYMLSLSVEERLAFNDALAQAVLALRQAFADRDGVAAQSFEPVK